MVVGELEMSIGDPSELVKEEYKDRDTKVNKEKDYKDEGALFLHFKQCGLQILIFYMEKKSSSKKIRTEFNLELKSEKVTSQEVPNFLLKNISPTNKDPIKKLSKTTFTLAQKQKSAKNSFRIAVGSGTNSSQKFWKEVNSNKVFNRPQTSHPYSSTSAQKEKQKKANQLEEIAEKINNKINFERVVNNYQKPYSFLSGVGGKTIALTHYINPFKAELDQGESGFVTQRKEEPELNNKVIKRQIKSSKSAMITLKERILSAKPKQFSRQKLEDQDIKQIFEREQNHLLSQQDQRNFLLVDFWHKVRPFSSKIANNKLFLQFHKKILFSDKNMPFESLFDRNQRTIAATFSKFKDLNYHTPTHRIGFYMEYKSKLTKTHLLEMSNLKRTMNEEKENLQIPIQNTLINPFEFPVKPKLANCDFEPSNYFRSPITLSLFPEYLEEEKNLFSENDSAQVAKKYIDQLLQNMNNNFDPLKLTSSFHFYLDQQMPKKIKDKMQISQKRYEHYLKDKSFFTNTEVGIMDKQIMLRAVNRIHSKHVEESSIKVFIREAIQNFREGIKKTIIDYILLSPYQRERLNITLLPKKFLNSSERYVFQGGYSAVIFSEQHEKIQQQKQALMLNMVNFNLIKSAIADWFYQFSHLRLVDLVPVKYLGIYGFTYSFSYLIKQQEKHKTIVQSLLKQIYYRGIIYLTKRNLLLKNEQMLLKGRWEITGFNSEQVSLENEFMRYCKLIENILAEKENNVNGEKMYEELWHEDKTVFQTLITGEGVYVKSEVPKDFYSNAAILISLHLRFIIENSITQLERFFFSYPLPIKRYLCMQQETLLESFPDILLQTDSYLRGIQLLKQEHDCFPILQIVAVYNSEYKTIEFNQSIQSLQKKIDQWFQSILCSFENLLHPSYCQVIQLENQKLPEVQEEPQEWNLLNLNEETKQEYIMHFQKYFKAAQIGTKPPVLVKKLQKEFPHIKEHIKVLQNKEQFFEKKKENLKKHICEHFKRAYNGLNIVKDFEKFLDGTMESLMNRQLKRVLSNDQFKLFRETIIRIQKFLHNLPEKLKFPLFEISFTDLLQQINSKILDIQKQIIHNFQNELVEGMRLLQKRYNEIRQFISKPTTTAREVEIYEKYVIDLTAQRFVLVSKASQFYRKLIFYIKQENYYSEELHLVLKSLVEKPRELNKLLSIHGQRHEKERIDLEEMLKEEKNIFAEKLDELEREIERFKEFANPSMRQMYLQSIFEFEKKIQSFDEEMKDINDKEMRLSNCSTNFQKFYLVSQKFTPHKKFWEAYNNFYQMKSQFNKCTVQELNYEEIEKKISSNMKISENLMASFSSKTTPVQLKLNKNFLNEIETMQKELPTLQLITSKCLRERHWKEIEKLAIENEEELDLMTASVREILSLNISQHLEQIKILVEKAIKQNELEQLLENMIRKWEDQKFVLIDFNNMMDILSGTRFEEIQLLLEDHVIISQTINVSPYIQFIRGKAKSWQNSMLFLQNALENLIRLQTSFLYLEPIFNFDDITRTLKVQSQKFNMVRNTYDDIMKKIEEEPKVLELVRIQGLPLILKESIDRLDQIEKSLESYLETKRYDFPRFFFLSNQDLISILSESKDPSLVQPHIKKCFEGVRQLDFSINSEINGMKSVEGEDFLFSQKVIPREFRGVEKWLGKLEEVIRVSLADLAELYIKQYFLNNQIMDYDGRNNQLILTINQIMWTQKVEKAITLRKIPALIGLERQTLQSIISNLRKPCTKLLSLVLSSLIVFNVHNIDIIESLENTSLESFEWNSQLRYYWEGKVITVKIINAEQKYGYQFIGNTSRLVITPLTDRCYRTLMTALQMNLGGAPEGPAGTGKTETVKDLAKNLAMPCIVFNCSEGISVHAMAKFFKGLCCVGAWSCFDQFNRIDIEVLSVIAQQILCIQQAKNQNLTVFRFEGVEISLMNNSNIFITMNPGYAGRSELPDNLKALFRPVSMMIPDYAMIVQISLYSYGFINSREMSTKIVGVNRLSSEMLSSQAHYDYGMRNVKAILASAEKLKQKNQNSSQNQLILQAIMDFNMSMFTYQDKQPFYQILSDLFPEFQLEEEEKLKFNECFNTVLTNLKLEHNSLIFNKVKQVYQMADVRHGIMILGPAASGKSTILTILLHLYKQLSLYMDEFPALHYIINPKSISYNLFFGSYNSISLEWTEGVLAEIFRKCAYDPSNNLHKLIIFDGPVDSGWIQNLNTVLDDNKKLCLVNGETIGMTQMMQILFEVDNIAEVSPATVSRCGMIYVEPETKGNFVCLECWLKQTQFPQVVLERIQITLPILFYPCIEYLQTLTQIQYYPPISLVQSFTKLLEVIMKSLNLFNDKFDKLLMDQVKNRMDMAIVWAIVWALGGSIEQEAKIHFDQFIRFKLKQSHKLPNSKTFKFNSSVIPPEGKSSVFEYYIDSAIYKWRSYKDLIERMQFEVIKESKLNEVIVETTESLSFYKLCEWGMMGKYPLLVMGGTGCGKTLYYKNFISKLDSQYIPINIILNTHITVQQIQEAILQKLEKRKRKEYAAKTGYKSVLFIDNLNMPKLDKYNAQPPLQLLREYLDYQECYSHHRQRIKIHINAVFSAMGLPGGNRNRLSTRLLRHFHFVNMVSPNQRLLESIFKKAISTHIVKLEIFDQSAMALQNSVKATIEMYFFCCKHFKPTPRRPMFVYNLRDVQRVISGMKLARASDICSKQKVHFLWTHQVCRIFYDRLLTVEEQALFYKGIVATIRSKLFDDLDSLFKEMTNLQVLGPKQLQYILFSQLGTSEGKDKNPYRQIESLGRFSQELEKQIEEHNNCRKEYWNLTVFEYYSMQVIKLLRIMSIEQGNVLLMGNGGAGRKAMLRLSCFIKQVDVKEVSVNNPYNWENWKQDVSNSLFNSGLEQKQTLLLNPEMSLTSESLSSLQTLLTTYNIPHLIEKEDFIPKIETVVSNIKKANKDINNYKTNECIYQFFTEQVKNYLHLAIVMSARPDVVRRRLRMYPGLIWMMNVLWMDHWPQQSLSHVARENLRSFQQHKMQLTLSCQKIHQFMLELTMQYQCQHKQNFNITPSTYFSFLENLKGLHERLLEQNRKMRQMYGQGVRQLVKTQEQVETMENQLNAKKPILIQMNKETSAMLLSIQKQKETIEPKKQQTKEQQSMINQKFKQAESIRSSCENDMAAALPKLKKAQAALDTIKEDDIHVLKSMQSPPLAVRKVLECICVMNKIAPISTIKDQNQAYWQSAKKFVSSKEFKNRLKKYDKNNIEPELIKKVREKYISQTELFNPKRVETATKVAKGICQWILAIDQYQKVFTMIRPKEMRLKEAEEEVANLKASVQKAQEQLTIITEQLERLEKQYEVNIKKQVELKQDIEECEKKLERASKLITGLSEEQVRWTMNSQVLEGDSKNILGNSIMAASSLSYLARFDIIYRKKAQEQLKTIIIEHNIEVSQHCTLQALIGQPITIKQWNINGLPQDSFSIENGLITFNSNRWPLMIDPMNQANRWIKKIEESNLKVIQFYDEKNLIRGLQETIPYGKTLLIENISMEFNYLVYPLICKKYKKEGIMNRVSIGNDRMVVMDKNFKLLMTTRMSKPEYSTDIESKLTMINFSITKQGLSQQLLETFISKEKPELQEIRSKLIFQSHENKKQLQEIQRQILSILSEEKNLLDSEKAIETLQTAKQKSIEIREKENKSKVTQIKINEARLTYKPIAQYAAELFMSISLFKKVNVLYQFSMEWFLQIYSESIEKSTSSSFVQQRLENVSWELNYNLFINMCQSLFEVDKTLFMFILLMKYLENKNELQNEDLSLILKTFPGKNWQQKILYLNSSEWGKEIKQSLQENYPEWQNLHQINEPIINKEIPLNAKLTSFQQLLIQKAIRPQFIYKAVKNIIQYQMGDNFKDPPPFNITKVFNKSSSTNPIMFLLPGSDPIQILFSYEKQKNIYNISLGQGQGIMAEKAIREGKKNGSWVVLQNLHLSPSWMNQLDKIISNLDNPQNEIQTSANFRLWLTTYKSQQIPITIIQKSLKVTNEPPKGIEKNIYQSYTVDPISNRSFFQKCKHPRYKQLIFKLTYFHAIIQQRRNYGSLGWNNFYDFNQSDLNVCLKQLYHFLTELDEIPFQILSYLFIECNYGGRVTEEKDKMVLKALYNSSFIHNPITIPQLQTYVEWVDFIKTIPNQYGSIGFHVNSEITKALNQSNQLINSLLDILPLKKLTSHDKQEGNVQLEQTRNLVKLLSPLKLDGKKAIQKYGNIEPINAFLIQQISRYNKLIQILLESLNKLIKALIGQIIMNEQLQLLCECILKNVYPKLWAKYSYLNLKPLSLFIFDLQKRIRYFNKWIDNQQPTVFWISGFYFTHSFLTANLQTYSRKHHIPIDQLFFNFQFFQQPPKNEEKLVNKMAPQDGNLVYGLHMQACQWNHQELCLDDPDPNQIWSMAPIILIKPESNKVKKKKDYFNCPVYKTEQRKGQLSTMGRSTNYILDIEIPSRQKEDYWVMRGVAMICQLSQ